MQLYFAPLQGATNREYRQIHARCFGGVDKYYTPFVSPTKTDHLTAKEREELLPVPGTEPKAFIIVCSTEAESPIVNIDLGISLQSMALKAVEIGLNALIVKAFNRQEIKEALGLPLDPLAVLAIGKGTERIVLDEVHTGSDLRYYRDADGTHHVPKIAVSELLI